jgi:(p)ppGpp synthase/HD superfamily hydrolase
MSTMLNALHLCRRAYEGASCPAPGRDPLGRPRRRPAYEHPYEVGCRAARLEDADEVLVAAGYLHALFEDTDLLEDELLVACGPEGDAVLALVRELTRPSCRLPRHHPAADRARVDRERAAGLSPRAKDIRLIDAVAHLAELADASRPRREEAHRDGLLLLEEALRDGRPELVAEYRAALAALLPAEEAPDGR